MLIVNGPPAELPKDKEFSDTFRDFIKKTLVKDATKRPSARELLEHPFITSAQPDALRELVQAHLSRPRTAEVNSESPQLASAQPAPDNIERTVVL